MLISPPYTNTLHLSSHGKSIPYPKNGQNNYGFKNLKRRPDLIDTIPELSADQGLKSLVKSLNTQESNFFSIGCFSDLRETLQGLRHRGYIEFAWNCTTCVQDAIHYFSLFFHFEQFLRAQGFNHQVKLDWLIEEAQFSDIGLCGFCCAIFIDTAPCQIDADVVWQASLQTIETFLKSIPKTSSTAIYTDLTAEFREVTA
ncbi:MAG: hypothetical protein AAF572_05310 [Cyanobacteria bacterium P01_B01_bin.77]